MMEATLAVRNICIWLTELKKEHDMDINLLDTVHTEDGTRDLVEITIKGKKDTMEEIVKTAKALPMILDFEAESIEGKRTLAVATVRECSCNRAFEDANCFLISARTAQGDWLEWNIIFTERASLKKLVFNMEEKGCEVKLKRISSVDENKMLTPKQEEIISVAYQRGYYDFPKRIGVRELAEMFSISTATLSEILRRGQKKIIERYLDLKPTK